VQKVDEPTGQEIRDYYRSHLDRYIEPTGVDVQQLIVSTEAQANLILQRIRSGEADFTDMVQTHSIDSWSKAKDGVIEKYRVGERRLDYLQGVAFDLEIGEISEPVRAPGGYALIKVLAKYPERQMSFDEVAPVVKQSVIATEREALLTELLENARNSVTIEFAEENLQYVNDPSEVLARKRSGGTTTANVSMN
jgi:parvulin-like peptidyl-prolyl isomerase